MNIFNYFRARLLVGISTKHEDEQRHKQILMKISELSDQVAALTAQTEKAHQEINTKLADLETQITNADVPQSLVDSFNALKSSIQSIDDIVPDAAPAPAPTPEPAP